MALNNLKLAHGSLCPFARPYLQDNLYLSSHYLIDSRYPDNLFLGRLCLRDPFDILNSLHHHASSRHTTEEQLLDQGVIGVMTDLHLYIGKTSRQREHHLLQVGTTLIWLHAPQLWIRHSLVQRDT